MITSMCSGLFRHIITRFLEKKNLGTGNQSTSGTPVEFSIFYYMTKSIQFSSQVPETFRSEQYDLIQIIWNER